MCRPTVCSLAGLRGGPGAMAEAFSPLWRRQMHPSFRAWGIGRFGPHQLAVAETFLEELRSFRWECKQWPSSFLRLVRQVVMRHSKGRKSLTQKMVISSYPESTEVLGASCTCLSELLRHSCATKAQSGDLPQIVNHMPETYCRQTYSSIVRVQQHRRGHRAARRSFPAETSPDRLSGIALPLKTACGGYRQKHG